MDKDQKTKNKTDSGRKNIFPFEDEIKCFIKGKISEDPDVFVEKMFKKIKDHWIFGKRSFQLWVDSPDINPFVNMILTRSGLLPLYTLCMLQEKDMFGNEIISEIEKRTSSAWNSNPGAIYPLLKELEERGFVEGHWNLEKDHPRRIYEITEKGRQEYKILKIILEKQLNEAIHIFKIIYYDIFPKGKLKDGK